MSDPTTQTASRASGGAESEAFGAASGAASGALILGGGLTGGALALALASGGIPSVLIDAAPPPNRSPRNSAAGPRRWPQEPSGL